MSNQIRLDMPMTNQRGFGARLADRLYALKAERGSKLTRDDIIDLADACLDEEIERRKRFKIPKKEADALFEAMIEACKMNRDEALATAGAKIGTAVSNIKQATPSVTPEEILRRARAYATKHPTWPLTPTSLAGHWSEFAPKDAGHISHAISIYTEPEGWRDMAQKAFKGYSVDWSEKVWSELSTATRKDILEKGQI